MLRIHLTLIAALGAFLAPAYGLTQFIPSTIQNGTSNAQFVSTSSPLDAPKVSPINGSAYDWWYFDAVSTDPSSRASVVLTFFTSSQPAFPLLSPSPTITVARIWVSFPNGTLWSAEADAAGATVVVPDAQGSKGRTSGVWHGTGLSWSGTPAGGYVVLVDAPGIGVQGTISFEPTAPPHYPCGPVSSPVGQTLLVGPNIGWANAVPDANASVDLVVGGVPLKFGGSGYADKNWSDIPFTSRVASWYWGHARLGPYSLVWFDYLDLAGAEHVSVYLARDNKIVGASCALGSVVVRPAGNTTYPPTLGTPRPEGYRVSVELDGAETSGAGKVELELTATVTAPLVGANPAYARSMGTVTGVISGGADSEAAGKLEGVALFEQFQLTS
ncbi:hypothetical protein DFH08DRAFT_892483 [Mycena albidolilacea]|uniref:Hydroxyneurosporene synthase n=1 Tax=Mycena albidolilacea TaxID=1033008 RepID=A0AAD6ZE26_9AGAR|nr:hypothetical protein DFH08DRAFT_892483 [Mycena albidolilacea]